MENVRGRFDFDNGKVSMHDVNFLFHGAPVQFASGEVIVEDSGRFALAASDLWVKEIRFDSSLRKIMPPLMAQFASAAGRRPALHGPGQPSDRLVGPVGEPAWCRWDKTLVVLIDNSLKSGIPLEHIQGQLEDVRGWSNGQALEVHGIVKLGSVSLMGQQITELESPFHVENGVARLIDLKGKLLKGELLGNGSISLDDTPKYSTSLRLPGARSRSTRRPSRAGSRIAERSTPRSTSTGWATTSAALQGKGDAHVTEGDLGELPVVLRFAKLLNINLALLMLPAAPASRCSTRPTSSSGSSTARPSSTRSSSPAARSACRDAASAIPWATSTCGSIRSTAAIGSTCRSSAT